LLPLAITNPQSEFVGMDSTKKKVEAIKKMVDELHIANVKLVRSRAEESKETYDVVCARAVAYVDKLLERTFHLVKPGGYFILFKQYLPEEKEKLKYVCKNNDIVILKEHQYSLFPEDIQRIIYVLQKK
jgi:16S rRNA (guanine527-N7)-methyltransferase